MDISDLPRRASIALLRKWVKALRSNKFKQTNGTLTKHNAYCCLGVLGRTAGLRKSAMAGHSYLYPGSISNAKEYRLLDKRTQTSLGNMNDSLGKTFDQIATHVEKHIIPRFQRAAKAKH